MKGEAYMAKTKITLPQFDEINRLATDILKNARNSVTVDLRFFDLATSKLEFIPFPGEKHTVTGDGIHITNPLESGMIATDGERFYYEPAYIIKRYRYDRGIVARDFLHSLLHCIFRHMNSPEKDRVFWNLACDIAVEQARDDFEAQHISASRVAWQIPLIEEMKKGGLEFFGAEKIYGWLRSSNLSSERLAKYISAFEADSHDCWYRNEITIYVALSEGEGDENGEGNGNADGGNGGNDDSGKGNGRGENGEDGNKDGGNGEGNGGTRIRYNGVTAKSIPKKVLARDPELSHQWEKISRSIASDLENFSKQFGDTAGNLKKALGEVNRERYDYTAFLRRFAVIGEAMKLNDDEFDYIPYTYGLSNYKNMPFIEPLEYKEVKRIRDFVIAIDTSGSVYRDQVQLFLQKTYNILKSSESFFSRVNIHIVQCDTRITDVGIIKSLDELEEYIEKLEIIGGGGTFFGPVFEYIDKCLEEKVFRDLRGMIFFTDGYGDFPPKKKKPPYEAAFVFVEDDPKEIPDLPPWAMRIILSKSDVEKL